VEKILEIRGAAKRFGGVRALVDANLTLYPREIHALLGENGAGKSTLLKTLAGVHKLDAGSITLFDKEFIANGTRGSQEQGIAVIYQEPNLFPDLTLAENVFIGRQLTHGKTVAWKDMAEESAALFKRLGVPLDPARRARGLSIADQQIVEIAKALSLHAKVIVMDEPTAALSANETERLFGVARSLREEGAALVFVSHRLDEVMELCDRVTIMRDGATVATAPIAEVDTDKIVKWMVGRELSDLFPKMKAEIGETILKVENISRAGQFEDISFEVKAGEIVGIAGLVGSGRSEVIRAIFGIDNYEKGSVTFLGKKMKKNAPNRAMQDGIALVPEDRRQQGLFMPVSITRNTSITLLKGLSKFGLLRKANEIGITAEWSKKMQLKFNSLEDSVDRLSGGNQQKVVLAKWLSTKPKLLIIDEPTRGIDVGTKSEVHRFLSQEATKGLGILMISSELPEVLGMSDRVLVMREGRLVAHFNADQANPENVIAAASGAGK
jgi:rhamnose transport system ATP-binding protein